MVKCDNPQMLSLDALSMSCMLDYSGEVVLEQIFRCWGSYIWNIAVLLNIYLLLLILCGLSPVQQSLTTLGNM